MRQGGMVRAGTSGGPSEPREPPPAGPSFSRCFVGEEGSTCSLSSQLPASAFSLSDPQGHVLSLPPSLPAGEAGDTRGGARPLASPPQQDARAQRSDAAAAAPLAPGAQRGPVWDLGFQLPVRKPGGPVLLEMEGEPDGSSLPVLCPAPPRGRPLPGT